MQCLVRAIVLGCLSGDRSRMMIVLASQIVPNANARGAVSHVGRLRSVYDAVHHARHGIDERREHRDEAEDEPR